MGLSYLGSTVALEEPKFHKNGGSSVKHKFLSGVVSSEADAVEKYYTAVTDMFFFLKNMFKYHLYT